MSVQVAAMAAAKGDLYPFFVIMFEHFTFLGICTMHSLTQGNNKGPALNLQ